jgi:HK97 family phage portal protein
MRKKPGLFARLFKSIPVINRLSTDQWFFQGTTRTLTATLGTEVTNPYETHAWVRGAIEAVALNIAGTPLAWKNSRGTKAATRDAEPWITLFEKPNELMGQQQLFEATLVYLLHFGECMWVLDRTDKHAIPAAIEPFNGNIFEAVVDSKGNLLRWKTETTYPGGEKKELIFEKWEVCFFKLFNPYDRLRGMSPLRAAQLGIDQDMLASQYNKAFFKNSALPGGVIEVEEEMTEESFNRMKNQFQEHHQGVAHSHVLALLEGGAKYKQLVPSQKDMEFLNQKKWNRDEVLACFKVPKLELGIWDEVNFAVAKVQAREFWTKTLYPKMKLLEYVLWVQLFSTTSTGKIFADFDTSGIESMQGDMVEKVEMAFKLWTMGYPINQLNTRFSLGLEKQKHGETPYVTNNTFQIDDTGKIILPVPAVDPNAQAALEAAKATAAAQPKGDGNANPKAK